jgi:hypothetical protein
MQVIQRTLFTSNGNQTGTMVMDINSGWKIFINPSYVVTWSANSKWVLSINSQWELIFSNMVWVTWATWPQWPSGSGTWSSPWVNNWNYIYYNNGNVGIGTANDPQAKLQVEWSILWGRDNLLQSKYWSIIWGSWNSITWLSNQWVCSAAMTQIACALDMSRDDCPDECSLSIYSFIW